MALSKARGARHQSAMLSRAAHRIRWAHHPGKSTFTDGAKRGQIAQVLAEVIQRVNDQEVASPNRALAWRFLSV